MLRLSWAVIILLDIVMHCQATNDKGVKEALWEKLSRSVKEKVEAKLKHSEVSDEFAKDLESELLILCEMKDLVQEKLAAVRDTLKDSYTVMFMGITTFTGVMKR